MIEALTPTRPEIYGCTWSAIRQSVHFATQSDLKNRVARYPLPTPQELDLGLYIEALEQQCREAIVVLHQKGYLTVSSGFSATDHSRQQLDGYFFLDQDTITMLRNARYDVKMLAVEQDSPYFNPQSPKYTIISFSNFEEGVEINEKHSAMLWLKDRWNELSSLLPDREIPAPPSPIFKAMLFREQRSLQGES